MGGHRADPGAEAVTVHDDDDVDSLPSASRPSDGACWWTYWPASAPADCAVRDEVTFG